MDEVEIINLNKRCNKTDAKAETKTGVKAKADAKTGAKAASKTPRSRYYLFLREQLEKMTGEDRRNYHSIELRRRKGIKENPARLSAYNNRTRQITNEAETPTKVEDSLSVGSMEQQMMTERSVLKTNQRQPSIIAEFVDTDSLDSDTKNQQEPTVK